MTTAKHALGCECETCGAHGPGACTDSFTSDPTATAAVRALYNVACHHPRCERGATNGVARTCSCGLSQALAQARVVLGIPAT